MMNTTQDPYFDNKIVSMNTNFLNFSPYANATNPEIFCFIGNAHSFKTAVQNLTQAELS